MGSELLTHIWDLKLKLDLPAYCTWRCCSRLYWEPNPFQWMLLEITSDCLQHHERRKSGLNFKNIFLDPYTTNSLYFKQSLVDSRTWNWYMLYGHYIGLDGLIVLESESSPPVYTIILILAILLTFQIVKLSKFQNLSGLLIK